MIIAVKASKLEKVNRNIFRLCAVTKNEKLANHEDAANMDILLPTDDLYIGRIEGSVGKKRFAKKYAKYLRKKNTLQEWSLYSIGLAVSKSNLCFVCTDEEWELGYLTILGETLADMYGVRFETGYKEAKEVIEVELEAYSKKERKLLDEDEDELSPKKAKLRKGIIKDINKQLRDSVSEDGRMLLDEFSAAYAIDQFAIALMGQENPVFEVKKDNDGIKNVRVENYEGKTKDLVEVIMAPKDVEDIGDVVKCVLKGHGIKYKKEKLKDLGKENLIQLIGELYVKLQAYRSDPSDKDDD